MVLAKKVALVKWQKPPELMTARTAPALVPRICSAPIQTEPVRQRPVGQALLSQERARKGVQMAQWHQSTAAKGQGPWLVQSWWQRGLAIASSGDRASLLWHCRAHPRAGLSALFPETPVQPPDERWDRTRAWSIVLFPLR